MSHKEMKAMWVRQTRETKAYAPVLFGVLMLLVGAGSAHAQTWSQVWSDEFNGTGAASSANWSYETGGGGWGNAELENYQAGTANSSQTGGHLNIQARIQSVGGNAYTSARLKTQGHVSFGPGDSSAKKIEGSLQGPSGQGLWPAFWMLGTNISSVPWPGCGEIDIMEHINTATTAPQTLHWDNGGHASSGFGTSNVGSGFGNYHTYGFTWSASSINGYFDGAQTGSANIANNINGTEEFHRSFFLILNLAVGGSWPGNPNSAAVFPANLNIDWIRYYQAGTGGATATPTNPPNATPTPVPAGGGGTIVNKNSNKCVDAAGASSANGTHVQQFTCNGSNAQKWTRTATSSGYVRVGSNLNTNQVWDVTSVSTADGGKIQLWGYTGGTNQQWLPTTEGTTGFVHLTARHSGKCLDVSGASTADAVQLQQWGCNGSAAQSFKLN